MVSTAEMLGTAVHQDDPIWPRYRLGCLTASRMRDARAMLKKGGEAEARFSYKIELVTERLTGILNERYVTKPMERGLAFEDAAKTAYEELSLDFLGPATYVKHPLIEWCGATPDSVTPKKLHEFKVPLPTTYVKWRIAGGIPEEHLDQLILQQACTGVRHTKFVAYCPELPFKLRMMSFDFSATDEQIEKCEADAMTFLAEVDSLYQRLTGASA